MHFKYFYFVIFSCAILFAGCSSVIDIPKAEKIPVPPTKNQDALIRLGVSAHDKGDYDQAISYYQKVIAENPDNVNAIYETAMTYFTKGDYAKSNEFCSQGIVYNSFLLAQFYGLMGNNYDNTNEGKKAIASYKHALSINPDNYLLHYNLGIAYLRAKESDAAKECFKNAISLNPNHPGSNQAFGVVMMDEGNKIPAIFAFCRFFALENNTQRAANTFQMLEGILAGGATRSGNTIHVSIDPSAMKESDEGDFETANLFFSLLGAQTLAESKAGDTKADIFGSQLESLIKVLAETEQKKPQNKFFFKHYLPYFKELQEKGYCKTLAQYIFQEKNYGAIQRAKFLDWSQGYNWKK